jgi:hypothetical protein
MRPIATPVILAALLGASTATASAGEHKHGHGAHEHGKASGSIAVEEKDKKVVVELEIPGDGIFGFEHVAKTKEQKDKVAAALSTLRSKTLEVVMLPSDAGCKATEIKVESSLEGDPKDSKAVHSDVDVHYTFVCDKVEGLSAKLGLLKLFPRVKSVTMQVLSAKGQSKVTVTKAEDAIPL